MINILLLLLFLAVLTWFQVRVLRPMNGIKEWSVFMGTMAMAAFVGSDLVLNLDIPSPLAILHNVVEPIGRTILH